MFFSTCNFVGVKNNKNAMETAKDISAVYDQGVITDH